MTVCGRGDARGDSVWKGRCEGDSVWKGDVRVTVCGREM